MAGSNVWATEWERQGACEWMRSFMVIDVEVGDQVGLQLAGQVMLVERYVLGCDAKR